jgi:hypothetical protein
MEPGRVLSGRALPRRWSLAGSEHGRTKNPSKKSWAQLQLSTEKKGLLSLSIDQRVNAYIFFLKYYLNGNYFINIDMASALLESVFQIPFHGRLLIFQLYLTAFNALGFIYIYKCLLKLSMFILCSCPCQCL